MTRIVSTLLLIATLTAATAPAFAINEVANCSAAVKSDWARCVIRQSKSGGE